MILTKQDGAWVRAKLSSYGNEAQLRDLLAGDGSLVPGCAGAAAVTEFRVRTGPIDVLLVDSEGVITVVECKLGANRESRREVVGQLIDYSSALHGTGYDDFAATFAKRNQSIALEAAVEAAAGAALDADAFRQNIASRLTKGQFRLVIAVDEIHDDLRRAVEFLNENTTNNLVFFALEIGYFKQDAVEVLVPRTFGHEVEDAGKGPTSTTKPRWTAEQVAQAVHDLPDTSARALATELLDHAKKHGAVQKGGTGQVPSAGFYYPVAGVQRSLWSLYVRPDNPVIALNFGSINNVSPVIAQTAYDQLAHSPALMAAVNGSFVEVATKYPRSPCRPSLMTRRPGRHF